uniref:Scinderin like a n=2 Tax=Gasterosteus aculeatus aculeatus TaxID=481459 RepID=A0AAQ4R980_GASAC
MKSDLIFQLWFRYSFQPRVKLLQYTNSCVLTSVLAVPDGLLSTMALHKEFAAAGKKPGLQVWRIEKMDLAPVPPELHGDFFTGDSYIVLNTTRAPSYNIHSWFGEEASQDEKGCAAIFMTQLDTHMKGAPIQFSEYQNNESLTFLGYFKSGIKYKKGGVASGFKHVVTNDANIQRLLHVKGRRIIRATEVPMTWDSFNKGDCFIIELGKLIYHWSGSECNFFERLKTTEIAIAIRDNERQGRGELKMIDEGSEPQDVLGPKPDLPSGSSDSDLQTDTRNKNQASLYLISNAGGSMTSTMVADKNPFKQAMLSNSECYIVDNGGDKKIFVWKGSAANQDERNAALTTANLFIKDKNYSPTTQIQILPAGGETTLFKQFFFNWLDKEETTGPSKAYTIGSIAKVKQIPFDASKLHSDDSMAAQHGMVDDGSGKVKVGSISSTPGEPSSYLLAKLLLSWQIRVTQGQEPPHLVSVFKANPLVVHLGGTSRESGESKPGSTRLFHIRRSSTKATRAVEVVPTASSLNTNDVFVLKSPSSLFTWVGKGATPEEKVAAQYVAGLLGGAATEVEESKEPAGFWTALGGKKDYQTSVALQKAVKPPRLFGCSNKTGTMLVAEEVPGEFTQMDLAPDDVMILDTGNQVYVWVGSDANETEKTGSLNIAEQYLNKDPSGRRGVPIATIKLGNEPPSFTGWFHAWDPDMWGKDDAQRLQDLISK